MSSCTHAQSASAFSCIAYTAWDLVSYLRCFTACDRIKQQSDNWIGSASSSVRKWQKHRHRQYRPDIAVSLRLVVGERMFDTDRQSIMWMSDHCMPRCVQATGVFRMERPVVQQQHPAIRWESITTPPTPVSPKEVNIPLLRSSSVLHHPGWTVTSREAMWADSWSLPCICRKQL